MTRARARRIVLPAVAAVLVSGLGFLAWRGASPGTAVSPTAVSRTAGEPAEPTAVAEPEAGVPERGARVGGDRAAVATPDGEVDDAVEVRVVVQGSGEPVAGAELFYVFRNQRRRGDGDREAWHRRFGRRTRADADGVARVTCRGSTSVVGRKGELYGEVRIELGREPDGGFVLELERDLGLSVQVLEHGGGPAAGVWVAMKCCSADGVAPPRRRVVPLGRTDERGQLEVRHLQQKVQPGAEALRLAPWVPGEVGASSRIVSLGEPLPSAPIVLRLPLTGRVTARATSASGVAIGRYGAIQIELLEPKGEEEWGRRLAEQGASPHEALFAHVVAGKRYRLRTRLGNGTPLASICDVVAGGDHEVVLATPASTVVLSGKVVDEQHRPLPETRVALDLALPNLGRRTFVTTDADSRIALVLGEYPAGITPLRVTFRWRPDDAAVSRAVLAPGAPLRPGVNDVGEIVLRREPLVVSGRFTIDGRPGDLPAEVDVEARTVDREGAPQWTKVPALQATPLPPGRFEVRGDVPAGELRLRLTVEGCAPVAPVGFVAGRSDLVVSLRRGGTLRAEVLVDHIELTAALELILEPRDIQLPDLGPGGRWQHGTALDSTLTARRPVRSAWTAGSRISTLFVWGWLWPGLYDLRVQTQGDPVPVAVVRGVRVAPRRHGGDPRLAAIDLRGRLHATHVRVVDEHGAPLPAGDVVVRLEHPDPRLAPPRFELDQDGIATIVTARQAVDLVVSGRGRLVQRLRGVRDGAVLRLLPWPTVQVRVATTPALPGGAWLQLRATAVSPQELSCSDLRLQGGSSLQLSVPGPGRYRLAVWLHLDHRRLEAPLQGVEPGTIEVGLDPARTRIDLRIPQAAVDAAVATSRR